ncbi:RNA polymerase sigma-70 factor, ECF subfamily [Chryseolinea serpens]|uniref:RNA polymerase sigma-70 factor, ECF subfamily n=1 Tax=Chryseolinea serpens TaxID=947013 RepID=A0A1M5SAD6_9BACT|nr:RNA polymerase sigma factor [Chryseolinea serpens]SHH35410.1 RNA polymerase sigma-70 factor, ECF subfamily [Chryseolinea serpens]
MKTEVRKSDEELITSILANDTDALGELYNRYYKKVFQKCLSLVKDPDEAFDLAQEALLKAFDHLKNFRKDSSFSTWLYIIAHRHCLLALRKKNKNGVQSTEALDEEADRLAENSDEVERRIESETIMFSLINQLPEADKELLFLKYREGESIESLQEKLQLSTSAIKMRLKRSKEKLNNVYVVALSVGLAEALAMLA